MDLASYQFDGFFDEMLQADGVPRPVARNLARYLTALAGGELLARQAAAERVLMESGATFNVCSEGCGAKKSLLFDLIPRMVDATEWERLEAGLKQRITALNLFIDDIYHAQCIVRDGVVPRELVATSRGFLPQCVGVRSPRGVWCHIAGADLVRDGDGRFYVLEDNLRCPSGVSYVLENRRLMKSLFPEMFRAENIRCVDDYPERLREMLAFVAPDGVNEPRAVLLTPGVHNCAYFEHSFLACRMGVELVTGDDLVVANGHVWMRAADGLERVDVIYRRIDDTFLDPEAFRADSLLGVPGLMRVFREGRVALVNAPGTGVADDKAVYAYVPDMVEYYLSEEAILPNVHTWLCSRKAELAYVLEHLGELVVKPVYESGGYGMLIGPASTRAERAEFARRIQAEPRNYIAQPTLALSRVPTLCDGALEGRHVDLRPYILYGKEIYVQPGGLTRVALKKGSLVVNSSQGGGAKDTWVLQQQ